MRYRIKTDMPTTEKRLLTVKEAAAYMSVGTQRARKFCDEIGATRHFGRSILFDREMIDDAISKGVEMPDGTPVAV